MLDKSSDQILDNNLVHIQEEIKQKISTMILCSETFDKAEFLNRLIKTTQNPTIVVDMDLLYTGYVESGMIKKKDNVTIFHLDNQNWNKKLLEIISKVSNEKFLVIIDSINGVYNMFDSIDSARFINSCIGLLSSIARQSYSSIVIAGIARKNENRDLVLSPGGKQVIQLSNTGIFFLKKVENDLIISVQEENNRSKSFKIERENQ